MAERGLVERRRVQDVRAAAVLDTSLLRGRRGGADADGDTPPPLEAGQTHQRFSAVGGVPARQFRSIHT